MAVRRGGGGGDGGLGGGGGDLLLRVTLLLGGWLRGGAGGGLEATVFVEVLTGGGDLRGGGDFSGGGNLISGGGLMTIRTTGGGLAMTGLETAADLRGGGSDLLVVCLVVAVAGLVVAGVGVGGCGCVSSLLEVVVASLLSAIDAVSGTSLVVLPSGVAASAVEDGVTSAVLAAAWSDASLGAAAAAAVVASSAAGVLPVVVGEPTVVGVLLGADAASVEPLLVPVLGVGAAAGAVLVAGVAVVLAPVVLEVVFLVVLAGLLELLELVLVVLLCDWLLLGPGNAAVLLLASLAGLRWLPPASAAGPAPAAAA